MGGLIEGAAKSVPGAKSGGRVGMYFGLIVVAIIAMIIWAAVVKPASAWGTAKVEALKAQAKAKLPGGNTQAAAADPATAGL